MDYQVKGNGLWTIRDMRYQEDGNGLWTISKMFMFYGLQYNEEFLQRKSFTLFYIFYIIT